MKKNQMQMKKKHVQLSFISGVISRNAFFRDTPQAKKKKSSVTWVRTKC